MTWDKMDENLKRLRSAGVKEVGEELPPTYTKKKPKHIPKFGKIWVSDLKQNRT